MSIKSTSERVTSQHVGEKQTHISDLLKDVKLAGTGGPELHVHSTHTEAQSSVGLSVSGTKHQRPLAGMHFPTAAVVRPAQRSIMGIIGARQRVLNRGTTWEQPAPTDKSAEAMQESDQ